jgi:hypothetical protein
LAQVPVLGLGHQLQASRGLIAGLGGGLDFGPGLGPAPRLYGPLGKRPLLSPLLKPLLARRFEGRLAGRLQEGPFRGGDLENGIGDWFKTAPAGLLGGLLKGA